MTRTERIEAALATKCGAMEYYLEDQNGGNLHLFFETVRDKESGKNITRLHDKDAAILFAASPDLRDEVLALRAQVERQKAALERLIDAGENYCADQSGATHPRCGIVQPITVAEGVELNDALEYARAALAQIESEEVRR